MLIFNIFFETCMLHFQITNAVLSFFQSKTNEESNDIAKRHVRLVREAAAEEEEEENDQELAESAPQPGEETAVDDQDRNKRYLPFGGSVEVHGGAGGGSGNFLFDLIRVSNAAQAA